MGVASDELVYVAYTGSTPGADANTYNLFNSTTAVLGATSELGLGKYGFTAKGIRKLLLTLKGNQAGTLKWYTSSDRGSTWTQLGQEAIAALAATASIQRDYLVASEPDFKLDWVNGSSAQSPWIVNMALDSQKAMF